MRNCSYASCGQRFYNSAYGFDFLQIFQIIVTLGKYHYHFVKYNYHKESKIRITLLQTDILLKIPTLGKIDKISILYSFL